MRVLVLGATGMLGSTAFRRLADRDGIVAFGTARSETARRQFAAGVQDRLLVGVDVGNLDSVVAVLAQVRPDVVVNCVGIIKQLPAAHDAVPTIALNALLPHRLAQLCAAAGARLVHISTDCVFSGRRGNYTEDDIPDAEDLYGRSKLLGEVDYPNAVTLRTSIIGHERGTRHGLIEWFLGQTGAVRGFTRAIFSGLTTDELTRVIAEYVLPRPNLCGVWHVSAAPIAKFDLLQLVKAAYHRDTVITPDATVVIDRSLDSTRFRAATGYNPPGWQEMVQGMRDNGGGE